MRAVVHDRYGPPEVLRLEDVERPVPKDDEVLVRIHATTVNRTDCGLRAAKPFFVRVPQRSPPAEAADPRHGARRRGRGRRRSRDGVRSGRPGLRRETGAHAELVCVRENGALAHMPAGMTFEEAAAVCDGACIALSCLRNADLRPGRRILVYGATGSVGTAAVQLARHFGAHVTAVANTKNLELVRSLGADEVIDYQQEDFTKNGETYDVIFDAVDKQSFRRAAAR